MKIARKIASRSPRVIEVTKRSLNNAQRIGLDAELDFEAGIQPFFVLAP